LEHSVKIRIMTYFLARCNDSTSFEKKWTVLEDAVLKIQQKQRTECGREELYKVG
jgi:hypothetical protein